MGETKEKRKMCSIDHCWNSSTPGWGWCPMHKEKWQKYGDPCGGRKLEFCPIRECREESNITSLCTAHYTVCQEYGVTNEEWPTISQSPKNEEASRRGRPPKITLKIEICAVNGCTKRAKVKGWCSAHYQHQRKYGGLHCAKIKVPGDAAFNALWSSYVCNAKNRGYIFALTKDMFRHLIEGNCVYCGAPPSRVFHPKSCHTSFTCSGIDRLDNKRGYTVHNCVSCCKMCNRAKSTLSLAEFSAWLKKITSRWDDVASISRITALYKTTQVTSQPSPPHP